MLTTNVVLTMLNIFDCGIEDAGAVAIADALKTNRSLEIIDLSLNPFTCNVITNAIAPMLKVNTTLKRLLLGSRIEPIREFAAGALLKILLDYNDTVDLDIDEYIGSYNHCDDSLGIVLQNISAISKENSQGSRCASFRRRRNIFKCLKSIWMAHTYDA